MRKRISAIVFGLPLHKYSDQLDICSESRLLNMYVVSYLQKQMKNKDSIVDEWK